MKRSLRRITEVCMDEPCSRLGFADQPLWGGEHDSTEERPFTLGELTDFCDRRAEGRNAHDFVGVHPILAALLTRRLGASTATDIMQEIAEYGGLSAMNGVCEPSTADDLGAIE